jgi:hypothetical protein
MAYDSAVRGGRHNALAVQSSLQLTSHQESWTQDQQAKVSHHHQNRSAQAASHRKSNFLNLQPNSTNFADSIERAYNLGQLGGKTESGWRGQLNAANRTDFFRFNLFRRNRVKLDLGKSNGHVTLSLLDQAGHEMRSKTNASLSQRLAAGEYFVRVATRGDRNTNYSLSLKGSGRSVDPGNDEDSALEAGDLSSSKRLYRDQVGRRDNHDFYRVDLTQNSTLQAALSGLRGDADLRLLDRSGNQVLLSSRDGNAGESIRRQLAAGTYFLQVTQSDSSTRYKLEMTANPGNGSTITPTPLLPQSPTGRTLSAATVMNSPIFSSSGQVNGGTEPNNIYRFTVNQSGIFNANLSGLTSDADVRLIQDKNNNGAIDEGNEVLVWQWEWGTQGESIRKFLTSGTYYLQVKGYGNRNTDYTINTNFRNSTGDDRKFSIQINYGDGLDGIGSELRGALQAAANFWENVIDYSSFNGAHVLNVNVTGVTSASDWLASAKYTEGATDANGRWMPTAGSVRINMSYSDRYKSNTDYLKGVLTHELAHVLGIGTLWEKNGRNLVDRTMNSYKADSYAGRAYGELNGTLTPTAIPLEAGTFGHWDENAFNEELLTPFAEPEGTKMPLSSITIGSLRDLGWNVNYGAADSTFTAVSQKVVS